jgi:hypothetical protein
MTSLGFPWGTQEGFWDDPGQLGIETYIFHRLQDDSIDGYSVVKQTINHRIFDGLYKPFMVILGWLIILKNRHYIYNACVWVRTHFHVHVNSNPQIERKVGHLEVWSKYEVNLSSNKPPGFTLVWPQEFSKVPFAEPSCLGHGAMASWEILMQRVRCLTDVLHWSFSLVEDWAKLPICL